MPSVAFGEGWAIYDKLRSMAFATNGTPEEISNNNFLNMYYVYVLQSESSLNQIYTGYTENLKERLNHHNIGGSPHTSKYIPWRILFYSAFLNKKHALDFEKYLKTASGIAFRNKRLIP